MYINGVSCISPQPTFQEKKLPEKPLEYNTNMLQCIEPDYKEFFDSGSLRRISRVIRMGWASAKSCLTDTGMVRPDAICVGTGKGCYRTTQVFLNSLNENREQFVPPSPFIQSAHSSIAAQIAIQTQCRGYNMTYAHRIFSFESALRDASMLLNEYKNFTVLTGGVDEIEEDQFRTFERIGHYKQPGTNNLKLLATKSRGTIAGEGSSFFALSNRQSENTYALIKGVATFSGQLTPEMISNQVLDFLSTMSLKPNDVDVVLTGNNGDILFDKTYSSLENILFKNSCRAYFKHLCGEYHTATAFATWLSAWMLKQQQIPSYLILSGFHPRPVNNILIYNHYRNVNHSLILLTRS